MCDAEWYKEFLELNPREAKRRDLLVDYAEAQADGATEYFRRLLPRYWFDPHAIAPATVGSSLGLTPDDENSLIVEMSRIVLPAFRAAPEYDLPRDASALRFPPPGTTAMGRARGVGGGAGSGSETD